MHASDTKYVPSYSGLCKFCSKNVGLNTFLQNRIKIVMESHTEKIRTMMEECVAIGNYCKTMEGKYGKT